MKVLRFVLLAAVLFGVAALWVPAVSAANNCQFLTVGKKMFLKSNCTTDTTILVPNGYTLDGLWHTITAVDPAGGHFVGAVVKNAGAVAHVWNLRVTVSGLADICDGGNDRLRGIMLEGASGSIVGNTVVGVTQVNSGCQEGNSIEVRNEPFDGTHPNTRSVSIVGNTVSGYMKTGILANGDVDVDISLNVLTGSANQAHLAANGVQIGFGAKGSIQLNVIGGNSWCCEDASATGILVFDASDGVSIRANKITGNADIGIYFEANNGTIRQNIVTESGPDGFYDVGIGNYGTGNLVSQNLVVGYTTAYES